VPAWKARQYPVRVYIEKAASGIVLPETAFMDSETKQHIERLIEKLTNNDQQ
jgi:hypothetical protein